MVDHHCAQAKRPCNFSFEQHWVGVKKLQNKKGNEALPPHQPYKSNDSPGIHLQISYANLTIYHELIVADKPERDKQCHNRHTAGLNHCFANARVFGIKNKKILHMICTPNPTLTD